MKHPVVRFGLEESMQTTLTQSKVGGFPYLPIGEELPKNTKTGNTLTMLAQINFTEMPHLPNFPTQGILQFFIDKDDDNYGDGGSDEYISFEYWEDYPYEELYQNKFPRIGYRVIYHADILPENQLVTDFSDKPVFNHAHPHVIVNGEFAIIFKSLEESESTSNKELESNRLPLHQIGGSPNFPQGDYFYWLFKESWSEKHILLFQLDSEYDKVKKFNKTLWSDCGTGNFFITPQDLKNLDFSKVAYGWSAY